eukprot:5773513-Amphidinium_carterae.2
MDKVSMNITSEQQPTLSPRVLVSVLSASSDLGEAVVDAVAGKLLWIVTRTPCNATFCNSCVNRDCSSAASVSATRYSLGVSEFAPITFFARATTHRLNRCPQALPLGAEEQPQQRRFDAA